MENLERPKLPTQDAQIRKNNFFEVSMSLTEKDAQNEAKRCLNCKNKPCVKGCPVSIDIPSFIKKIAENDEVAAYDIIKKYSSLPAVCGRVCPQEKQCEANCIRGMKGESIAIGALERYVADKFLGNCLDKSKNENEKKLKHVEHKQPKGTLAKVAVVGSGPSGLACAGELAKLNYEVTVFEALHKLGGVLSYGIPEFRLPKSIVEREIENLKKIGVKFLTNVVIGKTFTIEELFTQGFRAIFLGVGAGLPKFMNIEGENLRGVYSANEFLTRVNLMKAYDEDFDTPINKLGKVAVIGGGNVAMDAARVAVRLGADKTTIVYRRSENEMPARKEEIMHAKEEGVDFKFLSNPKKIISDKNGAVSKLECVKMELGDFDESGRRKVIEKSDDVFSIEVNSIIMAIGTSPNPIIRLSTPKLNTSFRGQIIVDEETLMTSINGVFAGGDIVSGAATVILAMGAGKKAAKSIDEYIKRSL